MTLVIRARKAHFHASGDGALRKPKTARIEALWLEAVTEHFFTVEELARLSGKSKRRIQAGLKSARENPISFAKVWAVEWISTPNAFVEAGQCEWHAGEPIPEGLAKGCLFCLKAGLEALISRHGKPVETLKPSPDQPNGPAKFQPNRRGAKK